MQLTPMRLLASIAGISLQKPLFQIIHVHPGVEGGRVAGVFDFQTLSSNSHQ